MTIDPRRISLRPATLADTDFVGKVSEIGMRVYVEEIGEVWDADLPRDRFQERWQYYAIVQIDGADIGCMDVADETDHLRLNVLYLLPHVRNEGAGTSLLKTLIARADRENKPVRLRVIRVNPAVRLYERLGFAITESIPGRFHMMRPAGQT